MEDRPKGGVMFTVLLYGTLFVFFRQLSTEDYPPAFVFFRQLSTGDYPPVIPPCASHNTPAWGCFCKLDCSTG